MASLAKEQRKNPASGRMETYFKIAYKEGTKQRRAALGFLSKTDAEAALRHWEARRLLGLECEPLTASPTSRVASPTLAKWWGATTDPWPAWPESRMHDWIVAQGFAEKTVRTADCARRAFLPFLGDKRLDAITVADGDSFVCRLRERGCRSRTCQIYLGWFQRSLDVAAKDGVIPTAPKLNTVPGTDRRSSPWLTPGQTRELYQELDRRVDLGICPAGSALAIRLGETLFMRPGEVLNRRWSDIQRDPDWSTGDISIRAVNLPNGKRWSPKNKPSVRTISSPPELLRRLRDHWVAAGQPRDGWIFPAEDAPDKPLGSFKKALAGACRTIGLPVLNPHALRHTGATRLAFAGVERRTTMKVGGWTTGDMLDEIYEHTSDQRAADVLKANEVVGGGVGDGGS